MWQIYLNCHQKMGILNLKKRVNRDKCSFTTKQGMFGVFAIDEIFRYRWTPFIGSRTLCHITKPLYVSQNFCLGLATFLHVIQPPIKSRNLSTLSKSHNFSSTHATSLELCNLSQSFFFKKKIRWPKNKVIWTTHSGVMAFFSERANWKVH